VIPSPQQGNTGIPFGPKEIFFPYVYVSFNIMESPGRLVYFSIILKGRFELDVLESQDETLKEIY